jgi:hypothetical protein
LTTLHNKLGEIEDAKRVSLRVDANQDGTFVTAVYAVRFSEGSADETFTWIVRKGSLRLYGYRINGNSPHS